MIRATLLLLLILAVPLQAQTRVPYSSLRAKLNQVRFFTSPKEYPPPHERVYRTSFDSATVKYINFELDLDYPRTSAAVTTSLDCDYKGPGGKTEAHPTSVEIDAGWTGSFHAWGWGQEAGGYWRPGSYLVTCRDGSTTVGYGTFEVTSNRYDIPTIRAMVTRVRVLESPRRLPPFAERAYGESFDSATTRYISTQIELDFPPAVAAHQFPIDCTYRYPNGETRNFRIDARVEATWIDSAHTSGWGNEQPGTWPKGTYQITCQHLDRVIVQRTFRIS